MLHNPFAPVRYCAYCKRWVEDPCEPGQFPGKAEAFTQCQHCGELVVDGKCGCHKPKPKDNNQRRNPIPQSLATRITTEDYVA